MYYFAYGSNMSTPRLLARVPSAQKIDVGILEKHKLTFHKLSNKDGSGKCNANETNDSGHIVYGVVFNIPKNEKLNLDNIEGLGFGYEQKKVNIVLNNGSLISAFTYYATDLNSTLKPMDWYKKHVLRGARENNLPEEYIKKIEAVEAIEDLEVSRKEMELSIYK